jgi:large subunit ribosomal protein L9
MKIILLQNIPKVGEKGEIKDVSEGYALNFLVPQKKARIATNADIKNQEKLLEEKKIHQKITEELIYKTIKSLERKRVEISAKANEQGHLFSKIHKKEIVDAIKESLDSTIEEDWIVLDEDLKEVGEKEITIKSGKFKAKIVLEIKSL